MISPLPSSPSPKKRILLVGFPNAGKTTLFNLLTGSRRKVSNYSGITVDSASGDLLSNTEPSPKKGKEERNLYKIIDLPGIYNLNPSSRDEGVTISALLGLGPQGPCPYDGVISLIDWERFRSSVTLTASLIEAIGPEKVLCLVSKDIYGEFSSKDRDKLQEALGTEILCLSTLNDEDEKGKRRKIDHFIRKNLEKKRTPPALTSSEKKLQITKKSLSYLPFGLTSYDERIKVDILSDENELNTHLGQSYQRVRQLIGNIHGPTPLQGELSEKIDKIFLHPLWGMPLFLIIFYLIFHAIYTWAGPVMDFSEEIISFLGNALGPFLPTGIIHDLVLDGIIAGVGGVVVFLPQILILFFLLSLLEQSGYISRAAIITDRFMSFFGLGGKAFLPYMSGFACAIPGIMAARTIADERERMATILTLPLITCSARLPVYILLIGTFIPSFTLFGLFNSQALAFFFLYFLGSLMALLMAKLLRLSFFKGKTGSFIIDLPHYQRPSLKTAIKQAWLKGKAFLKKAGTIILGLSIVIWFLSTYPRPPQKISQGELSQKEALQQASYALEYSAIGRMGKVIAPVLKPLGMDWKMGVGLIISFGARELFVSAMGTIYALGDVDEENTSLRKRMKEDINPETGAPVYDLATAWSLLIFFALSLQCTSTLAILKKETRSWKYPVIGLVSMFLLAYGGSFMAYHLVSSLS